MKLSELVLQEGVSVAKKKGEPVFFQGDLNRNLYLVESGVLKAYYTAEDGREFIKSFIPPGNVIGSMMSFSPPGICSFGLQCLESSKLKYLDFDRIRKLGKTDIDLAGELIDLLVQLALKKEQREYELLCLSAEQRFSRLMQRSPRLFQMVTQNGLARYLGLSPVGFSRIKKRLMTNA